MYLFSNNNCVVQLVSSRPKFYFREKDTLHTGPTCVSAARRTLQLLVSRVKTYFFGEPRSFLEFIDNIEGRRGASIFFPSHLFPSSCIKTSARFCADIKTLITRRAVLQLSCFLECFRGNGSVCISIVLAAGEVALKSRYIYRLHESQSDKFLHRTWEQISFIPLSVFRSHTQKHSQYFLELFKRYYKRYFIRSIVFANDFCLPPH